DTLSMPHAAQRNNRSSDEVRNDRFSKPVRAELRCSPDAVAISAPNVALLDLFADGRKDARVDQPPDVGPLRRRVAMIELEHHRVFLATVDAGMGRKVLGHESTVAGTIDRGACLGPGHVRRDVLPVVLLPAFKGAGPAVRLVPALRGVLHREVSERLCDLTARADTDA